MNHLLTQHTDVLTIYDKLVIWFCPDIIILVDWAQNTKFLTY